MARDFGILAQSRQPLMEEITSVSSAQVAQAALALGDAVQGYPPAVRLMAAAVFLKSLFMRPSVDGQGLMTAAGNMLHAGISDRFAPFLAIRDWATADF